MQNHPRQFAIRDQHVRAAAEESVRNFFVRKQAHHLGNRFVAPQAAIHRWFRRFRAKCARESDTPGRNSTPSSFNRAARFVVNPHVRLGTFDSKQHRELVEHAAHASRANRQHGVAGTRFAQHEFHARLHRAGEHHVLVARRADRFRQLFAGDALDTAASPAA